jgi:RimJ/RimL family protein N-acetyltransferase
VRLEPVDPAGHAGALFAAGSEPRIWDYLGVGPFEDEAAMRAWLDACAASEDPLFFTILVDGRPEGMCSYLRIEPGQGVIEIGWIWFSPALQRTRAATEAIFLLARTAFDLGYRRLEWKCDARNQPSRRAAERFGFTYEGVFRQHMVIKDRNRDTAWYAIVDQEWPSVREAFEGWLADENFDEGGRQRERLDEIRARLGDHRRPSDPDRTWDQGFADD